MSVEQFGIENHEACSCFKPKHFKIVLPPVMPGFHIFYILKLFMCFKSESAYVIRMLFSPLAGEDISTSVESVIPKHNPAAITPSEVYNINDS